MGPNALPLLTGSIQHKYLQATLGEDTEICSAVSKTKQAFILCKKGDERKYIQQNSNSLESNDPALLTVQHKNWQMLVSKLCPPPPKRVAASSAELNDTKRNRLSSPLSHVISSPSFSTVMIGNDCIFSTVSNLYLVPPNSLAPPWS